MNQAGAETRKAALEARLREWAFELGKLSVRAEQFPGEARAEYGRRIAVLRARMEEAAKGLRNLRRAGGEATEEIEKGIENALAELRKAVSSAAAKFQ